MNLRQIEEVEEEDKESDDLDRSESGGDAGETKTGETSIQENGRPIKAEIRKSFVEVRGLTRKQGSRRSLFSTSSPGTDDIDERWAKMKKEIKEDIFA